MTADNTVATGLTVSACGLCGVKIQKLIGADRVIFATGAHGTREILYQRVCQHVKDRPGCINRMTV
jgi:hypothetical protein